MPPKKGTPLAHSEFERHWRIVTLAAAPGIAYALLCVTGAPRLAFLIELGATARDLALITALGSLMFAFQVISGLVAPWLPSRKYSWMLVAASHRLLFALVLIAPAIFDSGTSAILFCVALIVLHDALAQFSAPIWIGWMADLVPADRLNSLWSGRNAFMMAVALPTSIAMALAFDEFERRDLVTLGYQVLGTIGILLGLLDILLYKSIPDPNQQGLRRKQVMGGWGQLLRRPAYRHFVGVYCGHQFAQMLAVPFLGLFLMTVRGSSALEVQVVLTMHTLGLLAGFYLWSHRGDTIAEDRLLGVAFRWKVLLPTVFLGCAFAGTGSTAIFATAMLVEGFADAAIIIATNGFLMKQSTGHERSFHIGMANFLALGISGGAAPLLAGWLLGPGTAEKAVAPYAMLFAAAGLMRIAFMLVPLPNLRPAQQSLSPSLPA